MHDVVDRPGETPASSEAQGEFAALGLRRNPFDASSGPLQFVPTQRMQQIFNEVTEAIEARKGLIVLTGEVGTGKTTLVNQLRAWLRKKELPTAFVFNPLLDADGFFEFALADFGQRGERLSSLNPIVRLQSWLLERYRDDEVPVLIVDEAQSLPVPVLEALGLLVNLEMDQKKLLQIVLVGQPEFDVKLKTPELRKVQQRVALRCSTLPLTDEEFHEFVEIKLRSAGADGRQVFEDEALQALLSYSRGIPRVLNLLCEHSLREAAGRNVKPIPAEIVEETARRFQFDRWRPRAPQSTTAFRARRSVTDEAPTASAPMTALAPTASLNEAAKQWSPAYEAPANRSAEQPDSQGAEVLVEIPPVEHKPSPVVAIDSFTSRNTTGAIQAESIAKKRPTDLFTPSSPGTVARPVVKTSPVRSSSETPAGSAIAAKANGILALYRRFADSMLLWLNQPMRTTPPRNVLGSKGLGTRRV
jgi:general secretion pathway protein A